MPRLTLSDIPTALTVFMMFAVTYLALVAL
jgi:hypothetical protein